MKHTLLTTFVLALCGTGCPCAATPAEPSGDVAQPVCAAGDTVQLDQSSPSVQPEKFSFYQPNAFALRYTAGRVLALDSYVKSWLKEKETHSASIEMQWDMHQKAVAYARQHAEAPEPDWLAYARDYNYPTFTLGLRYNFNHGTTMHRDAKDWGEDMEVDYTTRLGDVVTPYGRFDRPLWRTRHWGGGYYMGAGCGYSMTHYDKEHNIDNELIGTHFNIFFTAGLFVDWFFAKDVALEAGIDFAHHSNGALYRPNKGSNYLGPFVGLKYAPQASETRTQRPAATMAAEEPWRKHPLFAEVSLGVGAKTLSEDWQNTQFSHNPQDPDYRTGDFNVYGAFSLQADLMYRYARRWASGLGVDVFYGDYAERVQYWEDKLEAPTHISPWSLAVALKHEAYYGRLSVRVGIGYYLYRHMGTVAKLVEQPYYERVGLFYTLSKKTGLSVGFSVNAHKTRADFTELQLACPIRL